MIVFGKAVSELFIHVGTYFGKLLKFMAKTVKV